MLQQADNAYHLNNFEAVPPNSLFCSIDQEKTFCGKLFTKAFKFQQSSVIMKIIIIWALLKIKW